MGFWESVKASFLGQSGIDYYAQKSSETLTEIRDSMRPTAAGMTRDDIIAIIKPKLGEADTAAAALKAVMIDTTSDIDYATWVGRVNVAFLHLIPALQAADPILPDLDTAPEFRTHWRRCRGKYEFAADLWLKGMHQEAGPFIADAISEWNEAMDELERLLALF